MGDSADFLDIGADSEQSHTLLDDVPGVVGLRTLVFEFIFTHFVTA